MPKISDNQENLRLYNADKFGELITVGDWVKPDYPFRFVPEYIGVIEHISQFNFKARVRWLNKKKARYVPFTKIIKIEPENLL